MEKRKIYDFLRDLTANNSKEWMDANRKRYQEARNIWLEEVALYIARLQKHDARFTSLEPRKTIFRITNNRMFHPDRPIYKDNFGFSPSSKEEPALYLHVSPTGSFIGGGLWRPENKVLKQIRAAFDYDGEVFKNIINAPSFQSFFGGLDDDRDQLKTVPKGYEKNHRHIDLLRYRNLVAIRSLQEEEVIAEDFVDTVEKAYLELKPMNDYFIQAMQVETE